MAKSTTTSKMKKKPSPNNIVCIDLTLDDEQEDDIVVGGATTSSLKPVRKRLKGGDTPVWARGAKRIKTENAAVATLASLSNEVDSDVEILDEDAVAKLHEIVPEKEDAVDKKDDEDIAIVGVINHTRYPHMRQHCTEKPFQNDTGYTLTARLTVNGVCCDLCYCYICDIPANECSLWKTQHCLATDQGPLASKYLKLREQAKKSKKDGLPPPALALPGATQRPSAPSTTASVARSRRADRPQHPGPFPPEDARASEDPSLTKCRHCGWFSRIEKIYIDTEFSCFDWCHSCGRVASEEDLGKKQSKGHQPGDTEILLGHKEIPFSLHANNPSKMKRFSSNWKKYGWTLDEAGLEEELFEHRLGKRPCLEVLLASIPITERCAIPKDGASRMEKRNNNVVSADETQAVLLEKEHDIALLRLLRRFEELETERRFSGKKAWLHHDLTACWNRSKRKGTIRLRVFLHETTHGRLGDNYMAFFFGLWYNCLPLSLDELQLTLRANKRPVVKEGAELNLPASFKLAEPSRQKALKREKQSIIAYNRQATENQEKIYALESGCGCPLLGGTLNGGDATFRDTLKQYMQEILPEHVECSKLREPDVWHREEQKIVSTHRTMRLNPYDLFRGRYSARSFHLQDWSLFLGRKDYAIARRMAGDSKRLMQQVSSLNRLMGHMENRGHTSAPFVEGLTVELLPFQLQSLQWAIERETKPGGIQSHFWMKLPDDAHQNTELYFNPILCEVSTTKPRLVRGGIIAEQMGLGKTVISLALILMNPAPAAPLSGNHVSSITAVEDGGPFWDPELCDRTSTDNAKRGSIISRGTLVVCNVSLVGQWVAEAKSKLTNPGLVYSYHGGSRKRDPSTLAQNSIVVTTYETLASDATFHKNKSKDSGYCAPCEQVRWWRVICDESHVLRNGNNGKAMAVRALVADNKWLVSGTPINTTVLDLKNQLIFLGIERASAMMEVFKRSFLGRIKDPSAGRNAASRFNTDPGLGLFTFFMRSIMMRHSQSQKYTGTNTTLMSLPPKTERVVVTKFSSAEQREYTTLEAQARDFYLNFKKTNGHTLSSHYLKLTQKLMPLRVACSGGQVPLNDQAEQGDDEDKHDGDVKPKKKVQEFTKFAFTSKLKTLVDELKGVRDKDPTSKCLVFSQFTSTLKWLQIELPKHGFQFRTLSGDMSMSKRAKALRDFQNDPPTTIFLLSTRAGAVGINLTQANCVFLMEPCFNPALEAQAIGRVYRLGQKRAVDIVRLVAEDTVETRIQKLLGKKYGSTGSSDESDGDKKPAAALPNSMVGSISSDEIASNKSAVVAEEFDLLFGVESSKKTSSDTEGGEALPAGKSAFL